MRSPWSGRDRCDLTPSQKAAAQVRFKSKIFCFEIDSRVLAEVIEVGSQPFSGPCSAYLVKMAKKIPIVVQTPEGRQLADHVFGFDDVDKHSFAIGQSPLVDQFGHESDSPYFPYEGGVEPDLLHPVYDHRPKRRHQTSAEVRTLP
jgi:hypothetical protein